jgi:hypothetical protein
MGGQPPIFRSKGSEKDSRGLFQNISVTGNGQRSFLYLTVTLPKLNPASNLIAECL